MSGDPTPHAKTSRLRRLREHLRPSPSPSPSRLPNPPSIGLRRANSPDASNLLENTLKRLSDRDRATLQDHLPTDSSDIGDSLEQALDAAKEKHQCCVEKRWTLTFAGRAITLQDEADKVVRWLNRFKAAGDIAVNADPLHAGLVWAGIRLLLEVAVSDANQMTSLLVGCETVLYMVNRLKVYMDFWHELPATLARANFGNALTDLCSHILHFLALAIQTYQAATFKRATTAFWDEGGIREFEKVCDKLETRVEIEAQNCDRELSVHDREHTEKLRQDLQTVLEEVKSLHIGHDWVRRLEVRLDLDKLPYAKGAMFNSYGEVHKTCHPATRVDVLRQIQDWAQRPQSKSIFWLNGMAGTGKSTISWTVAKWLTDQGRHGIVDLGASFFFKRGEGDRASAVRFFPTITRELVLKIPRLDVLIAGVISSDPFIFDKSLGEQFDKLIYQPLQKVNIDSSDFPTLVLVVDALDECEKESDVKAILDLWSRLAHIKAICVKLFLTSRPDLPIQLGFKNMSVNAHQDMILHDEVPRTTIQHDISVFMTDAFSKIRKEYNDDPPSGVALSDDWPGDKDLQTLVETAVPLFIIAATVCRFVGDANWDAQERLMTVLQYQTEGYLEQMEKTYLPVLTQLPATLSNSNDQDRLYHEFQRIVGSIVVLAEPLSMASLTVLLNESQGTIRLRLRPLHSVLHVPADAETPIRPLHLSFREFLLSEKIQDKPFGIDGPATHRMLLSKCLQLLSGCTGLRENLCNLEYPGQPRRELDPALINERLSPVLQYACRYWVHHVQHSMARIHDDDEVHAFLQKHFLHWLEALSFMNRIAEAISHIGALQSLVSVILANRYIADLAPLQIYSSAMVFAPKNSLVRNICSQVPPWLQKCPIVPAMWSPELQKLEGHTYWVNAVTFSQDGLLASGSYGCTVRLWNLTTGQETQKLEGHTRSVNAVAFSQNGLLASGSDDRTVRLWNPSTGQEMQRLEGHTNHVNAIAFSPKSSLLASGSHDNTIRLWDLTIGKEMQRLKGHTKPVISVIFSQDSSLLASESDDNTIRLWDLNTGQETQKLEGRIESEVAFSQDGLLLASALSDRTIRLWNSVTGQEMQRLEGHTGRVQTAAFSQDGSMLASGSLDQTVKLWDPTTGQQMRQLEGHNYIAVVVFSEDGSLLASGSLNDRTIRLWNPTTGQAVRKFENVLEVTHITITFDNKILLTNRGPIPIDDESIHTTASNYWTTKASDDWIQRNDQNFLWLPQEYRASHSAFHDDIFALGIDAGHVSFIQLDRNWEPSAS
ncbi:MAG: hypothetical protein M1819_003233 [Sarea resinae]|nr:MAG: hypothetical protein M1819_003233 [Sarea resinae]